MSEVAIEVAAFVGLVLIHYLALLALAALIIRPVQSCPACFADTVPVRVRWLGPLRSRYEWRWCPSCRWQALARRSPG